LCGRVKKLDDHQYYMFKVKMVIKGEGKNKKISLMFYAKQTPGKSKLNFEYTLPKYTENEDSLIKVAIFMIDYCLSINKNFELQLDKKKYEMHKLELTTIQTISFTSLTTQIFISKEERHKKLKYVLRTQLFIKLCMAIKKNTKSKAVRKLIYKT
jgi:hypothetical protein